jgi:hypothetical protein
MRAVRRSQDQTKSRSLTTIRKRRGWVRDDKFPEGTRNGARALRKAPGLATGPGQVPA